MQPVAQMLDGDFHDGNNLSRPGFFFLVGRAMAQPVWPEANLGLLCSNKGFKKILGENVEKESIEVKRKNRHRCVGRGTYATVISRSLGKDAEHPSKLVPSSLIIGTALWYPVYPITRL